MANSLSLQSLCGIREDVKGFFIAAIKFAHGVAQDL